MFPGGNALNVAVFAHRAGAQTAYIGAVGTDRAGRLILRALQEEGVDVSHVRVIDGPTAYADVVLVDGDRQFIGSFDGVSRFDPDAADLAFLQGSDLVHSSTYSGLDSWVAAVEGQLPISFDFSDRIDPAYVRTLAPQVMYALFSGSQLTAEAAEDLARWTVSLGAKVALVTRGVHGGIACIEGRCWTQPMHPAHAIDTLGAGDAFLAAFLVAHLQGTTPQEALARATEAAAAVCTYHGAFGRGGPIDGNRTM
jgi:fructoselysine 6-kinase